MTNLLFGSRARVGVLNVVLFSDGLHLREIGRRAGVSPSEAKRELDALVSLGILVKEKVGNVLVFRKNAESPILEELTSIFLKTEGGPALIARALKRFEGQLEFAFVFGSLANGSFSEKSDVDVLVVGRVSEDELASVLFEVQKKLSMPVNFILWSENDFSVKLKQKSSFVKNVAEGKRIWLAGDEREFERLVEKAFD